ncbi:MAG TPA: hypothetical protein VFH97_00825, partial [Gemmatimonadales bacterium]|nr:hypothetical protein [Gemmatimonadales bacterium]
GRMRTVVAVAVLALACRAQTLDPGPGPVADLAAADQYSEWSAPENLGPPVNTTSGEFNAFISKDGLSLYFNCDTRCPGFGGFDIWVSRRQSPEAAWETPQNLGLAINTAFNDHLATLSPDGHRMYFASDRPGLGANDVYESRRQDKRDDLAWQPPVSLGDPVSGASNDVPTAIFDDEATGLLTLYIASNRPGGQGDDDVYAISIGPDGTFGPAIPVTEVNTPFRDTGALLRRDGLELFLASNRPGTAGLMDIWVSTRATPGDVWSTPVNLEVVNSAAIDGRPALSFEGTELYFQSTRPGGQGAFDLWVARRSKARGID